MATLLDTPPTSIVRGLGFALFRWGDDQQIGSEITSVYSPTGSQGWRAVRFEVMAGPTGLPYVKPLAERELTAEEIAHFEGML